MTRSYGQLCGLALALDTVGDRWGLLIVRELLVRPEGARYTDLRAGLPGIATNLLADRLRALETAGVVRRDDPVAPVATPLLRLTELGRALRPAVEALAVWGGAFVPQAPVDAAFRSRWLIIPLEALLHDTRPDEPPVIIAVETGDEMVVVTVAGGIEARAGIPERAPDLRLCGPGTAILGLVAGRLPLPAAESRGVVITGDRSVLARVELQSGC